ncbi:MAG: dihydrodipicolinate synthase family protein, partial [Streptosporangiaceae bacterium]
MRFRRDPSSLRGSIAPVVTPFTEDGQLDTEGLRRLIGWQLDSGSHGISLGGSTGEPSAQTPGERIAAMTEAARVIADRVPFLPGTGSARLDETLELTAAAAGLGADAALVITPYYARPTQEGLFQWYATVA